MKYLLFVFVISIALAVDCNATSYEFLSSYSLGNQDELNKTFDKIKTKMPAIPSTVYQYTDRVNYTVSNFTYNFSYLDTTQVSEIVGRDQIIIKGGKLRITFALNWSTSGTVNKTGYAEGRGTSDEVIFTKRYIRGFDNNIMFDLVDYFNVSFSNQQWNVTRIDPYTDEDYRVIKMMVNHIVNATTPKDLIIDGINTYLPATLNDSLHQDSHKMDRYFNYTYVDPWKGKLVVPFQHNLITVDLDQEGIDYYYATQIVNFSEFRCGPPVPSKQKDPKYYGGTQEFMSLGVYESTVLYGIKKGFFDSDLDGQRWPSSVFQFYAGDLYDVIPNLRKNFFPSDKIAGSCKALEQDYKLIRGGPTYFNVSLTFNCSMGIGRNQIGVFMVKSLWEIEGKPSYKYLDFVVKNVTTSGQYQPYQGYEVKNEQLANWMLQSCLASSIGQKVFGSNYSVYTRDYPHFEVDKDGYTTLYDSSHVELIQ